MRHRELGEGGPRVPVVGQGTWQLELEDGSSAIAAIRRALDEGAGHLDTAEMYGSGEVERLVGRAISGRRDEAFLVSKVLPQNATRDGTVEACERSLKRLGTDRLDCYLLHWSGPHPLAETVAGFRDLHESGKILSWGVSNFDASKLEELLGHAASREVACNQVLYHLGERAIEHEVLPMCQKHGIAVVGYSPFGSGRFASGRARATLDRIASRRGATARQIALAFLVRLDGTFTIPRSSDPEHVAANAAAADLVLDAEEIAAIDAAFPRGPRRWGVPVL